MHGNDCYYPSAEIIVYCFVHRLMLRDESRDLGIQENDRTDTVEVVQNDKGIYCHLCK